MNTVVQPAQGNELATRFNRLFRDGKLLQVHVSKWSMQVRLQEEDLPLEAGSKIPDFVRLGNKMLIDEKELKKFTSLESVARSYLRANAYTFPIAQAHFVPTKKLLVVLDKLEEFRARYIALVDAFISNYDAHKETMLTRHVAHREDLLKCYPSPEVVRSKFLFHVGMFEVAFPAQMKEIDLAAVQAEGTAREVMQRKFEEEWRKQYSQSMVEVDNFLKDAVASSRGRVVEVFETIAKKVRGREIISATNMKTMHGIIDAFDGLDFLNDTTVKEKLATVKTLISSGRDFKEDNDAIIALGDAVGEVLAVAKETSDMDAVTGEYMRRIDL